jgi:hypothetical protein
MREQVHCCFDALPRDTTMQDYTSAGIWTAHDDIQLNHPGLYQGRLM